MVDVTNFVQQIVSGLGTDPYANNGFRIALTTESIYRAQNFASSDFSDATQWPELTVTYTLPCDASFTYSANSNAPGTYYFAANNTNQSFYSWTINGNVVGNTPPLDYTFTQAGEYAICLNTIGTTDRCTQCIGICISDKQLYANNKKPELKKEYYNNLIPPTDNRQDIQKHSIKVAPNPSKNGWQIALPPHVTGPVHITFTDIQGRIISRETQKIKTGNNILFFNPQNISAGTYFIEIKGENITYKDKVIKL